MGIQIRIAGKGRTEDGWIDVKRDLGHNFANWVREAALAIPVDAIAPKPTDEEVHTWVKSVTRLIRESDAGKLTVEELEKEMLGWNPGIASAFKHHLTLVLFQKYREWRLDLLPMRPKRDEESEEDKDGK